MNWIVWGITFCLPEYYEVGPNLFSGEVENRTPLVWKTLMVGLNLKLSFSSVELSGYSECLLAIGLAYTRTQKL